MKRQLGLLKYLGLKTLSNASPLLPRKMTQRFGRSAAKRDPNLALRSDILAKRIKNFALFDIEYYEKVHQDKVGGIGAYKHFACNGILENRIAISERKVASVLWGKNVTFNYFGQKTASSKIEFGIVVFCHSRGNIAMKEIAENLVLTLRAAGASVRLLTEGQEKSTSERAIIVAPHEFFMPNKSVTEWTSGFDRTAVMLSTEQPQTKWFRESLPYILNGAGVIELCWQTSEIFSDAGFKSTFFVPSFQPPEDQVNVRDHPLILSLPQAALDCDTPNACFEERPIDFAFFGTHAPNRDDFFCRGAKKLAGMSHFVLYRSVGDGVLKPYGSPTVTLAVNNFVLQRSKMIVNIHRDDLGYFEVHRTLMMGIWNGALVVSDRTLTHPIFKAGEHYLEETVDGLPKLMEWLVSTEDGRKEAERVRKAAFETAQRITPLFAGSTLLEFLSEVWSEK